MAVYIQVDVHLRYHRRTKRLADLLGVTPREAMSFLICLWSTAAREAEDGVLAGWDDREIACASDYDGGGADRYVKALLDSGWLEGDRTLHGWQNHYGRNLQARKKSRERWQAWEERQRNPARQRRASGVSAARRRRAGGAPAAPLPFPFSSSPPITPSSSLSQSYPHTPSSIFSSKKIDSDSSVEGGGMGGGETSQHITDVIDHGTAGGGIPLQPPLVPSDDDRTGPSSLSAAKSPEAKKPVVAIPIVSSKDDPTQGEFQIYRDQVDEWSELFPAVDVEQELREMRAWCLASPERRKTRRGVLKFVTGWLSREQDRGRPWRGPTLDPRNTLPSPASSKASEEAVKRFSEWDSDRRRNPDQYVSSSEIKSVLEIVRKAGT